MKIRHMISGLLLLTLSSASWAWTDWIEVDHAYFEPIGNSFRMVVIWKGNFNSCGWFNAGNINLGDVGETGFSTLRSVLLTAMTTGRAVSIGAAGCDGDRARVIGLIMR